MILNHFCSSLALDRLDPLRHLTMAVSVALSAAVLDLGLLYREDDGQAEARGLEPFQGRLGVIQLGGLLSPELCVIQKSQFILFDSFSIAIYLPSTWLLRTTYSFSPNLPTSIHT